MCTLITIIVYCVLIQVMCQLTVGLLVQTNAETGLWESCFPYRSYIKLLRMSFKEYLDFFAKRHIHLTT